jgi:pyruvate dehydrogenase (quinone)
VPPAPTTTVWAARYLATNGKRRLLGSFWNGSMANAMAQKIGAQSAFPGRQVISLSGVVELEQKSTGFLANGTDLQNPNFAAMAAAVGVKGIRLEDPGEVAAGIAGALAHDGPVLVDAVVNRTELAMPPAVSLEMAKGFTLYMIKAVMSGRGDELLDLAKTSLWRQGTAGFDPFHGASPAFHGASP